MEDEFIDLNRLEVYIRHLLDMEYRNETYQNITDQECMAEAILGQFWESQVVE